MATRPRAVVVSPPPSISCHDPENAFRAESSQALNGQRILEIRLEGNLATRDATILRELFLQPGDPYDADLLARDLRFLEGLGIFALVGVVPRMAPGGIILTYCFVERGELRYGLLYPFSDYRDDNRIRAGLVYRHRNLFGGRESLWFKAAGGWEERVELSISRPWLGAYPIEHRLGFAYLDNNDEGDVRLYHLSMGFWLSLSHWRPLAHRFLLQVSVGERRVYLEDDDGSVLEKIASLTLGYSRDTRDSFLRPGRGGFLRLIGTLYDPVLGSSVVLRRGILRWGRYQRLPLGWTGVLALDADRQWGDLFYRGVHSLGGMDTVRGYSSGAISGWDEPADPAELGEQLGRNRLVLHAELRRDVLPRFTLDLPVLGIVDVQGEGLLFVDAGYLWSAEETLLPSRPWKSAYGFGTGLRIYTPIGDVLRMELGLAEAGRYHIHLGSGLNF